MASRGYISEQGYRRVWVIGKGEQYEHRVVAEKMIGRPLAPGEHVHHINGDKLDNRPENLEVLTAAEHMRRHVVCVPEKPCSNCGQLAKPLRRGRCNACSIYFRSNGTERPERLYGPNRQAGNQWGVWPLRKAA